jgi:hypothetical protein
MHSMLWLIAFFILAITGFPAAGQPAFAAEKIDCDGRAGYFRTIVISHTSGHQDGSYAITDCEPSHQCHHSPCMAAVTLGSIFQRDSLSHEANCLAMASLVISIDYPPPKLTLPL